MIAPALTMHGIAKRFAGIAALVDAELTLAGGEVHALMGANGAGKSTLMNVLGGLVAADAGETRLSGRLVDIDSPRTAKALGIGFVSQELNMLQSMTVAENVLIDHFPTSVGIVDRVATTKRVDALLRRLGCRFSSSAVVETLGMGDRQMVEIARALSRDPTILIFDEPTSSLSGREKRRLFGVIAELKKSGTAIVYITHFLDEIFSICDRVTVMRNGSTVGSGPMTDFVPADIVTLMLGDVHQQDRLRTAAPSYGELTLTVRNLSRGTALRSVNLSLRAGEIVGLWGLLGSGRTELMRAILGLDRIDSGEIQFRDRRGTLLPITPTSLQSHVGFVTEDRRGEGLFLPLSVARNISFTNLDKVRSRFGFIDGGLEKRFAQTSVERLRIKLGSVNQPVRTLSGGNQQKVVFARWVGTNPPLFFLDEPTRGLDVGAKTDILRLTIELAEAGAAVLITSSELEELMRVCDRYLVMQRGAVVGELPGDAGNSDLMSALSAAPPSAKVVA